MAITYSTDIKRLLNILKATGKQYDIEKIQKAYEYAKALHDGQFRASGEAYISHPIAVSEIVAGLELDTDSICAALLHDTVEDCSDKTNLKEIEKMFGTDVAVLVDGLTKNLEINVEDKEEAHIENIRKMLLAMSRDVRVIFIKLCDRLHNMRTLSAKPEEKQRTTALETMQVYAPLAHRLGMQKIKQELENISISYLDPYGYAEVQKHIEQKYGQSVDFIESTRDWIDEKLKENQVGFILEGRIKSVYSVYRKMFVKGKSFDEIYDFYALRIIVNTELECYTVLGIMHEMFRSVPGRFKDYISTPKPNMYRSIHTTVIGTDGIPFEVQIRTREMHQIAEYGVAAHWKYKSNANSKAELDRKLEWIARLIETDDTTRDPDEFMQMIKGDFFNDEVFVFTPKGDVIALAQGATVIDFAYAIHSAVGNKMIGAKINGMIVPIDRAPLNGDIVEIITSSSSKGPSRDWLKIVKTGEARAKIRQFFKKEKRTDNISLGKTIVANEIKRYNIACTESQKLEILTNVAKRTGYMSVDDLYNILGYGGLQISKIATKIRDEFDRVVRPTVSEEPIPTDTAQVKVKEKSKHVNSGGVIVDGEYGCSVKFAKCCNPLPGDRIIGFITKGYGISIHKSDCHNVLLGRANEADNDRWVEAHWELGALTSNKEEFEARLQIVAHNSIRLIADITMALADMRVSILEINSQKYNNNGIAINLRIACKNISHCESIISRLRGLKDVESVVRPSV
ncbi:MAG: bifunctional (p)ppGpp synthetase/guanosine-3',5'-bis(diphosphate) 3'-pyrophosphohydrolase [Clostridia bacterium]|nr:bifunctional (p)ppGpp synthetase/guanosine-3',5'-bis(diphosphate) 3'-pyrophosphohydrolase [Clostridia bacterium]